MRHQSCYHFGEDTGDAFLLKAIERCPTGAGSVGEYPRGSFRGAVEKGTSPIQINGEDAFID